MLFDVFKGRKSKKGHVQKVRSVGHVYYDEESEFCEVEINGLEKSSYILAPETDIHLAHDYVIYYEALEKENLESVGVGYLLHEVNAGLIQLEWDFYDSSNIYIDLSQDKIETKQEAA